MLYDTNNILGQIIVTMYVLPIFLNTFYKTDDCKNECHTNNLNFPFKNKCKAFCNSSLRLWL